MAEDDVAVVEDIIDCISEEAPEIGSGGESANELIAVNTEVSHDIIDMEMKNKYWFEILCS